MDTDKNKPLRILKNSHNKENEIKKEKSCECEEKINIQSQIINSLKFRIEELENDFNNKDQNIKTAQQKFQLVCDKIDKSYQDYGGYSLPSSLSINQSEAHDLICLYDSENSLSSQDTSIKNNSYMDDLKNIKIINNSLDDEHFTNALYSAYMIDDLNSVKYPSHIDPPNLVLNSNSEPGKFKYDRDFMMQFMNVCTKKPKNLPTLDIDMDEKKKIKIGSLSSSSSRRSSRRRSSSSIKLSPKSPKSPNSMEERFFTSTNFGNNTSTLLETSSNLEILPKTTKELIPIEVVQREIRELLQKLEDLEMFDSISNQIIDYVNEKSEKDGYILKEIIRLIVKRLRPQNICAIYAKLCNKITEKVDPEIMDEDFKTSDGKFIRGGTLFRKYLLNRCQEDFEKGWKVNTPGPSSEKGEPETKSKRRGLGLMRFIGEIFKFKMITERIMHECIKKLLKFQGSPDEEEIEVLCELMNTIGEQLDHVKSIQQEHRTTQFDDIKAKQLMNSYFNRLSEISKIPNLSPRIKSMIMNVINLRKNAWKPLVKDSPKKKISEIKEHAGKQKDEVSSGKNLGIPKTKKMESHDDEGWSTVGRRNKNKVGDLTKFGSVNRNRIFGNRSFAPGGIFGVLSKGAKGWGKPDE